MQERHSSSWQEISVFCGNCSAGKIAENSISRLPASLTNLSGSEAKEKIDAEVKYLKFEYLKKKKWIIIQSHSTIEGKECKQHRPKCSLLS